MNSLLFLVLLAIIVWFWQANLRYREYAVRQCKKICREMNLQLLDQTVALTSLKFSRDHNRNIKTLRRYSFEISMDGANRCKGYIILLGLNIIHTEFDLPDGPVILQKKDLITYH
jgi:hypothetical protein